MIVILYPAGAFGSTIEYCIRRFSKEFKTINTRILPDGSMHGYSKNFHPTTLHSLSQIGIRKMDIITPVYPNNSNMSLSDIVDKIKTANVTDDVKFIFVTLPSIEMIERNYIFVHYKARKNNYDSLFPTEKIQQWNKNYTVFSAIPPSEKRQLLSTTFDIDTYINATHNTDPNWLTITSDNILFNFNETIQSIIEYLGLTYDSTGILEFSLEWREKQQYVLDEHQTVNDIVAHTLTKTEFSWNNLSLIGEALVQHKLTQAGVNLKWIDIKQFPSNIDELLVQQVA
jgi:hypothetical protein